jgi:hypothetical protein
MFLPPAVALNGQYVSGAMPDFGGWSVGVVPHDVASPLVPVSAAGEPES